MLKVKIEIDDGNGKKAKIQLNEVDNLSKLVIIDKVFSLFGVQSDVFEMTETYNKIGKAYSSFFNEVDPIEPKKIEQIDIDTVEIKDKLIEGFTENKEELENTYKETRDQPEFLTTGIKVDPDGTKRYRLHYKCYACYNKGTHYVYPTSKTTFCYRCRHEFSVEDAHPEGFPNRDTFGNFFVAGDFKDWNVWS